MLAHAAHHIRGDGPGMQRRAALGRQTLEHLGQARVAQAMAHGVRLAVGAIEVICSVGRGLQRLFGPQLGVQPRAHGKPFFRQLNGGIEEAPPGQLAVHAVGLLQHAHHTRHPHRASAHHGLWERHGLAVGQQKQAFISCRRRGLAAVPRLNSFSIPMHQESTTANAAGLGLHEREHHLDGDGGVQRAAASLEHLVARIGGQRVGRRHHEALGRPTRLGGQTRGTFRQEGNRWQGQLRGRWRGRRRTADQQGRCTQDSPARPAPDP